MLSQPPSQTTYRDRRTREQRERSPTCCLVLPALGLDAAARSRRDAERDCFLTPTSICAAADRSPAKRGRQARRVRL